MKPSFLGALIAVIVAMTGELAKQEEADVSNDSEDDENVDYASVDLHDEPTYSVVAIIGRW